MSKEQRKIIFNLAGQILPFVVITTTFVCIARIGCHSVSPFAMDETTEGFISEYNC